jgi:hypothetical protein
MDKPRFRSGCPLGESKKKTITLPAELVERMEQIAIQNQISFTDLIGRLCSQYLDTKKRAGI